MNVALVTGSAGLIGSESVAFFSDKFDLVVGIDNNMRQYFFGTDGSTEWNRNRLADAYSNYAHRSADIREVSELDPIFREFGTDIKMIVHAAAQPSHDWAAQRTLHRLYGERQRYAEPARNDPAALPRCRVHFHLDKQSVR